MLEDKVKQNILWQQCEVRARYEKIGKKSTDEKERVILNCSSELGSRTVMRIGIEYLYCNIIVVGKIGGADMQSFLKTRLKI